MKFFRWYRGLNVWERAGVHVVFWSTSFALVMLFLDFFEGGPFVSMLTLGLFVGALVSRWPAVSQVEVFGSVIHLQRLSRDADKIIESLERSRVASYRLFLHMILSIGAGNEETVSYSERPEGSEHVSIDVKEGVVISMVLQEIEDAKLLEELADDLVPAMSIMVLVMARRMTEYVASNNMKISSRDSDDPDSPEKVLTDYELFLNKFGDVLPDEELDGVQCAIERMRMFIRWESISKHLCSPEVVLN